jgi:mono/diheme cytochrome c family protein
MAASRLSGWLLPGLAAVLALPVALLVLAWGDMYVRGHTAWPTDVTVPAPGDPTRGAHLLVVAKCGFCHGADYGGGVMMDDPMLGAVRGPNLTPGGVRRTDADIVRALRLGVNAEGHALLAMPTTEHAWLTDAEIADILAALRVLPPVDRPDVPSRLGPGMAVLGALDVIELYAVERLADRQRKIERAAHDIVTGRTE